MAVKKILGADKTNIDLVFKGISRLPREGEEVYTDEFEVCLGGGSAGTLINLARLNVPVKLLTYLSDDMFSSFAKEQFSRLNLPFINLYGGGKPAVNVSTAILTPSDRTFVSYGTNIPETKESLNIVYQEGLKSDIIIMERGNHLSAYQKLKEAGKTLVFDPGYNEEMTLSAYEPYLSLADCYLPNRLEAQTITGETDITRAAQKLNAYFDEVVIKLDGEGTFLYKNGQGRVIKSIEKFSLAYKDSIGAGDAFLAGFLYGLSKDYTAAECVLLGNITGGKCVTGTGCLSAYCTEEELLELYSQNIRSLTCTL